MESVLIVISDLGVDFLNQLAHCFKSLEITKLIFEPAKEGFLEAILPRRAFVGSRDADSKILKILSAKLCHKLCTLIGVEDLRDCPCPLNGLFDGGEDESSLVVFAHLDSNDLPCDHIFDGSKIPPSSFKWNEAYIRAPQFIWCGRHPLFNEVVVGMVACRFGAEAVCFPSGSLHSKQPHHSRNALVVDVEFPSQPNVSVGFMGLPGCLDETLEFSVSNLLLSRPLVVKATDADSSCHYPLTSIPANDLRSFFSNSHPV